MRTLNEIKQELRAARLEAETVAPENMEALRERISNLSNELRLALEAEQAHQLIADEKLRSAVEKKGAFSFVKFLREAAEGKLTGTEAEIAELGVEEAKRNGLSVQGVVIPSALLRASTGQNAGTPADGGNLIETAGVNYIEALKARMVTIQLGAKFMGGLNGQIPFVTDSNISAAWGAEDANSSVSKIAFSKATMVPKRNFVSAAFSKTLLQQTSKDVEEIVLNKLISAHATLLETAAIAGTGTANQPTGILKAAGVGVVDGGTNGSPISWEKVVALETEVNNANAGGRGKMAYLTNAKVLGALKTTEKATGTARFLLEGNMLNGYAIDHTTLVPSNLTKGTSSANCSAMIFGNWEDLYIGQWGGLDIVVDPYTLAKKGEVEITLNAWNDVLVARPQSFAAIKDITTV